jgi:DNA-binding NtrC family response regulator
MPGNQTEQRPVILTVDAHSKSRATVRAILEPDGFQIMEASDPDSAVRMLNSVSPDLVLLDFNLAGKNGLELALQIKDRLPHTPVIMVTEGRDMRVVVQAIRRGIYDHLTKPLNAHDLRLSVSQALEDKRLKDELRNLKGRLEGRVSLLDRMGSSDKIQSLVRLLEKISPAPFTVLIEGESGSGKELVARAIHDMSAVREGPFIAVDCGAIPETLFESELFGYAKGAFTGATKSKAGFFEAADRGTLFLDEVCNLSYTSQQKLLRAIEERQVQRIGTVTTQPVNVRIIAASNRPLEQDVDARLFRVDLLYRLKEVSVRVPPLRERPEDVCYLAQRFLDEFRGQLSIACQGFSGQALMALMHYHWPGNVRELRNVVRQAALICDDHTHIQVAHLPLTPAQLPESCQVPWTPLPLIPTEPARHEGPEPSVQPEAPTQAPLPELGSAPLADMVQEHARDFERRIIRHALEVTNGNKMKATKLLKIDYKTLYRKLKQLGID